VLRTDAACSEGCTHAVSFHEGTDHVFYADLKAKLKGSVTTSNALTIAFFYALMKGMVILFAFFRFNIYGHSSVFSLRLRLRDVQLVASRQVPGTPVVSSHCRSVLGVRSIRVQVQ
jgi:hypothetical protein